MAGESRNPGKDQHVACRISDPPSGMRHREVRGGGRWAEPLTFGVKSDVLIYPKFEPKEKSVGKERIIQVYPSWVVTDPRRLIH